MNGRGFRSPFLITNIGDFFYIHTFYFFFKKFLKIFVSA